MALSTFSACEETSSTQNQGSGSATSSNSTNTDNSQNKKNNNSSSNQSQSNLGNYNIVIEGCRLATDYKGEPIVIVKYQFTNNDSEATAFMWTFEYNVYQNGIGLNECYVVAETANFSSDNQSKEIKKGRPYPLKLRMC